MGPLDDVVDETGELLARLRPGSWTSLTRAPGRHRLFAVEDPVNLHARRVGVLSVVMREGHYYYVAVDVHPPDACVRGGFATTDLVPVASNGLVYDHVRGVLAPEHRLAPVPRGVHYPYIAALRNVASRRYSFSCSGPRVMRMDDRQARVLPIPFAR